MRRDEFACLGTREAGVGRVAEDAVAEAGRRNGLAGRRADDARGVLDPLAFGDEPVGALDGAEVFVRLADAVRAAAESEGNGAVALAVRRVGSRSLALLSRF